MGRIGRTLGAVLLAVLLTSCISIETTIDVRREDRIRVDLVYTIPNELWNAGVFDEDTRFRAIPLTRSDALRIARTSRSELKRYRVRSGEEVTVVSMRFRPQDAASLNALFGGTVDLGASSLAITLTAGGTPYTNREREVVEGIAGDATVAFSLRHPGRLVRSEVSGTPPGDPSAVVTIPLRDILLSETPVTWTLSWE